MESGTGLFGKLPAHGDFVRRALPPGFVEPWDQWLSAGMVAIGDALDTAWPQALPFAFHLRPGLCGSQAWAGVVLASADLVGRKFPLTLAAPLAEPGMPDGAWFGALVAEGQRAIGEGLEADRLLSLLPTPPPTDPDATLTGQCRFWGGSGPGFGGDDLPPAEALGLLMGLT